MRREICSFVLLLLGAVICVSVIPQTDLPETSYNEVDTPVNQASPRSPWREACPSLHHPSYSVEASL